MILVKVNGYDLSAKPLHAVTSGTVGRMVSFDFSPEWADLVKTAVFKGSGEARDVALLASDTCTLPLDVLEEHGGDLLIGVYGRNAAGTVVMPTVWGRVEYIREGAALSEADPSSPAPDWTAQVQAAAAAALEKAEAVETAAGRGDFDGDDGADGVSPAVSITTITGGHRVTITDADHPQGQAFDVLDGQGGGGGSGQDGVSPAVTIEEITGGHRVTITDADHPQGQTFDVLDGSDGQDGSDGTNGSDGADGSDGTDGVSPAVSVSSITGGHRVTITDADHPSGQVFDVLDGADGATGPAGPGVPAGGSAGQVLKKQSATDYDTAWANEDLGITGASVGDLVRISAVSGGKPTAFEKISDPNGNIGIVQNTDTATQNITKGQYVIWHGALYTASAAIASGATLSSSNLTAVPNGGLNDLTKVENITTIFTVEDGVDITINAQKAQKKAGVVYFFLDITPNSNYVNWADIGTWAISPAQSSVFLGSSGTGGSRTIYVISDGGGVKVVGATLASGERVRFVGSYIAASN